MVDPSLDIKITCQSSINPGAAAIDGHPWRNWKIRLVAMEGGKEHKGKLTHVLDRVEYILHPTFENPRRVANCEPYMLQEKGWGEFDLRIVLYFKDNLVSPEVISFDLNFRASTYSVIHKRFFPDAPPEFMSLLYKQTLSPTITNKRSSPSMGGRSINNTNGSNMNNSNNNNVNTYHRNKISTGLAAGPSSSSAITTTSNSSSQQASPSYHTSITSYDSHQQQQQQLDSSYDRSKRGRYARTANVTNNDTAFFNKATGKRRDGLIVDDVYTEQDLEHVHPIHRSKLEQSTRQAWGIPMDLDMIELATRLSRMTDDQVDEFQSIIQKTMTKDMTIEETDEEIMVDLYSLGPQLLNSLWQYTEKFDSSPSMTSSTSKEADNNMNGYNGLLDT
ncbi:yeats family-domain-containing protein [Halteromyces radiatus]|uniref:yeats family-domain-containing protein n=1 Tax=Halteromyces radiatus TaxID=101107 RepID=UPI00222049BA|nr:yeats family-domain-containing protein [Halteromyces radiatus]KAI8076743.1 yeats family-domain-containing protein [Halteromyces radiatus]